MIPLIESPMLAAQVRAQRDDPEFGQKARRIILLALKYGPKNGEELTAICHDMGVRPAEDRAFGAIYKSLSQSGAIRCVGYYPRTRGRGAPGRIWALADHA